MFKSKSNGLIVKTEMYPYINRSADTKDSPFVSNLSSQSPISKLCNLGPDKFPSLAIQKLSGSDFSHKKTLRIERIYTDPNKVLLKKYGKVRVLAANTSAGPMKIKNHDRAKIILNIKRPENLVNDIWPSSSIFAIYGGHGGKRCAEYLKANLHNFVFEDGEFPYNPRNSLNNAYLKADLKFNRIAEEENDFSGSCALATLIIGNKCFVANAGDSKAILSINSGQTIISLSNEHKALNETEHKRILQYGGELKSSYIIDNRGYKIEKGSYKIIPGNIPISRSIGNIHAKLEKLGGNPKIHIPNPEIKSFKIHDNYDFILMCSFGILENLSIKEVVDHVWEGIIECESESIQDKIANGLSNLMNEAVSLRCEDNITVIIIGLKNLIDSCRNIT